MTWSLHIRSAFVAIAAVTRFAASDAEADASVQDEAVSVQQFNNPFDNVGFFYPMLDKQKLVGLMINDGMILPPPTIPECRQDDEPLDHPPELVSGSSYQCRDWLLVNARQPDQAISPCSPVVFQGTNVASADGRVHKSSGADGTWDARAISDPFDVAGVSGVRGISFQPSQNDATLVGGLDNVHEAGGNLMYAAVLTSQGKLRVRESGVNLGVHGAYSAGSSVSVVVNHANHVEYRVDGEIRYVSAAPVPESLRAKVGFKSAGAALDNFVWAPEPAAHASIKAVGAGVDFKFQRGVVSHLGTGHVGSLANNGQALSVHTVSGADHIIGFTFQPLQADKELALGLTPNMGSEGRGDTPFNIKCSASGGLTMIENGVETPLGSYEPGDLVEMSLNDAGKVEVKVNGDAKFTSTATPPLPLAVEANFQDARAGAYNVKWAGMEACLLPETFGHPIGFDSFRGVTQLERGHFMKVSGSGWESGHATSLKHFTEDDAVSGVSFQIASNKKSFLVGLSKTPLRQGRIADYAIRCMSDGRLFIHEGGRRIGQFGKFAPHDRVAVIVNAHGSVEFSVNGLVRYTSKGSPGYPLNVVASLKSRSAEIYNVMWTNALEEDSRAPTPLTADTPTHFHEIHGVAIVDDGVLRKLASLGDGWNAGAVSVDGLPHVDHVGGVSFKPRFSDRWLMVGLGGGGTMMGWDNVDFAAHCKADGTFVIVEKGSYVGEYGHYVAGDKVELVVNEQDHVEYKVQGQIRYVSKSKAAFPLSVKTFFHHSQAEAEIQWSGCIEHLPYEGLLELSDPVDFCQPGAAHSAQDDLVGFTLWDGLISPDGFKKGGLQKMDDISPGHYGTAVSFDEIADSSVIAGFSFQPLQESANVMMGLTLASHLEQRINDRDLDFAVLLTGGGELQVYESGRSLGSFGQYHAYDAIEIRLSSDDIAEVFVNGQKLEGASSDHRMTLPLRAVALIRDPEAVVYNIRWVGQGVHAFTMADGAPIEFAGKDTNSVALVDKQRMRSVPGSRQINAQQGFGNGVESRAVSMGAITETSQVKGVQFQLPGSSRESVLVGLHPNGETQDLAFALRSEGGTLVIYEGGVRKEGLGPFKESDTLSIVLTSASTIEYRLGCQRVIRRDLGANVIESPLHVHVFLSETTEVANFVWIGQQHCPSGLTFDEPMVFDQFNGLGLVGAGSVRKFTSSGMDWNSEVLSTNAIMEAGQGFIFGAPSLDTQALVGFISCSAPSPACVKEKRTFYELDYAMFFSSGSVSVWEKGSLIGDFGTYEAGQPVRLTVNRGGEMEYTVNNQVRYTSIQRPSFPIKMSAFILNPGGRLDGFVWLRETHMPSAGMSAPDSAVTFHRFRGGAVVASDIAGALQKLSSSAAAWNAGAVSESFIASPAVNTKGISFRPKSVDEHHLANLMVGLNRVVMTGGPSLNYKAVDFGVLLLRTGELQVFEKGEFKGSFGTYKADDVIKILYSGATVEYRVNDEENARYISENTVQFPLFVDVALHDAGAEVGDVKWA